MAIEETRAEVSVRPIREVGAEDCEGWSKYLNWKNCPFLPGSPKIVVRTAVEEVTRLQKNKADRNKRKKNGSKVNAKPQKGFVIILIIGLLLMILGISTLIWTPYDICLSERLKMMPGLPPYEWWKEPPDAVVLRMYVFNITNSDDFIKGKTTKLNVKEIGPYLFREKFQHTQVKFNDNGTLTYVASREAIYLPELNNLSLNDTIIVPNLAVLGISSYLWNAPFIARMGLNMIMKRMDSKPFVNTTVFNYLWNFTDPLMGLAKSLAPYLVPEENMGVLHQIYKDFVDEITVNIGTQNGGRKFFTINKFRGGNGLSAWENETCDSVQGSTEGVSYHQGIHRNDTLKYLRKTICRVALLHYTRDEEVMGMDAYRFELTNDTFSRPPEGSDRKECFHTPGSPVLPSGISDVSPCYYGFPIVSSFPHFMYSEPTITEKLSGLSPDPEKHGSYVVVEPITGVPFKSNARSQSSLIMRSMSGFPRLRKFGNMVIPMFWAEYNQESLPWYVSSLMYFTVIILPSSQLYFSSTTILISSVLLLVALKRILKRVCLKSSFNYSSLAISQKTKTLPG